MYLVYFSSGIYYHMVDFVHFTHELIIKRYMPLKVRSPALGPNNEHQKLVVKHLKDPE